MRYVCSCGYVGLNEERFLQHAYEAHPTIVENINRDYLPEIAKAHKFADS
jgi:hypothetical protein